MNEIESPTTAKDASRIEANDFDFHTPNKTKQDVARFLGVTVRTVETMMSQSGLPYYRLGSRRVRFRFADVMEWMEEKNKVV